MAITRYLLTLDAHALQTSLQVGEVRLSFSHIYDWKTHKIKMKQK